MANTKRQSGFTLIELMIVIAILGIIAAIAIPAYQHYTIRAKISEAVRVINPLTAAIGVYYWSNSAFPTNLTDTGQSNIQTEYVEGVTILPSGLISIDVNEATTGVAAETVDEMYIIVRPQLSVGALEFECSVNNAQDGTGDSINLVMYAPSSCR
jgi:type IV pilus assembly protein PilA